MEDQPITILLIEDNPGDVRLIEIMLAKAPGAPFTLEAADTLAAGLQRLRDPGIDLVLLDLGLPETRGLASFDRVHAHAPDTPVVVLTGLDDEQVGLEAVRRGAQDYLVKGKAGADLLARTIRYGIERRRFEEIKKKEEALRRINKELRELDRMKSAFIQVTSHELRTPLTALLGMLTVLGRRLEDAPPKVTQAWFVAHRASKRLERLVTRILEIAISGDYVAGPTFAPIEIDKLVERVARNVDPFLDLRKQSLLTAVPDDLPPVPMDPDMIDDVLLNLVMNAIKFTPDGGTIHVEVRRRDPDTVEFSVRDTGTGIAEADKPHIFENFFSSFDTLHHSSGEYEFGRRGIGLGLAIARKFVTIHGGTIWVDSEPGKGADFRFTLPLRRPEPQETLEEDQPHVPTADETTDDRR